MDTGPLRAEKKMEGELYKRRLLFKAVVGWVSGSFSRANHLRDKWIRIADFDLTDTYAASTATLTHGRVGDPEGMLSDVAIMDDRSAVERVITWSNVDGGTHGVFAELSCSGIGGLATV